MTPLNGQTLLEVSEPRVSIPETGNSSSACQNYFLEISSGCGWLVWGKNRKHLQMKYLDAFPILLEVLGNQPAMAAFRRVFAAKQAAAVYCVLRDTRLHHALLE